MWTELRRFSCLDDHGETVVLIERQKQHSVGLLVGGSGSYSGASDLVSESGLWANDKGDGTFTLKDGRIVRGK